MEKLKLLLTRFEGDTIEVDVDVNANIDSLKGLQKQLSTLNAQITRLGTDMNKAFDSSHIDKYITRLNSIVETVNKMSSKKITVPTIEDKNDALERFNAMRNRLKDITDDFQQRKDLLTLSGLDFSAVNGNSLTRLRNEFQGLYDVIDKVSNSDTKGNLAGLATSIENLGFGDMLTKGSKDALDSLAHLDILAKNNDHSLSFLKDTLKECVDAIDNTTNSTKNLEDAEKEEGDEAKDNGKKHEEQSRSLETLGTKYTELLSKIRLYVGAGRRIASFFNSMVTASSDMIESINLYKMALGEALSTDAIENWQDEISKLYLDPRQVYQYSGQFFNLAKGLGVSAKDAEFMSRNLTQLTFDMTSYLNLTSNDKAFDKLQSAMSGQTKAVTNVGIAVQKASLDQLAYELGIEKTVSEMTQAEKTYLRYIQIMRSTTQMQGDLGRTIITPTNAMRLFTTQVMLLTRAIGQVLTPVVMKMLPWLIAATQLLTELAQALASALGFTLKDYEANTSGVSELFAGISDGAEDATKATGKLNRTLAKFDDLNVVESASSGAGAGVTDTIDFSKYLQGYDMLKEYTDKIKNQVDDIKEKIKQMLPYIQTAAVLFLSWKIAEHFMNSIIFINDFLKAWKGVKGLTVFTTLGKALGKLTILKQFPAAVSNVAAGIGEWLTGGATFGEMISGIAGSLGVIAATIGGIIAAVKGAFDIFKGIKQIFEGDTFKGVLRTVMGIAEVVGGIALLMGGWVVAAVAAVVAIVAAVILHWEEVKTFFVNLWNGFLDMMSTFGGWIYENVIAPVGEFFVGLGTSIIGGIVAVWDFFVGLGTTVATWIYDTIIKPIYDYFEPTIKWFSDLFTSIFTTLSDIVYDIVGLITGTLEAIYLILKPIAEWIYKNVIKPVADFFVSLWDGIKEAAKIAWEFISSVFIGVATWFYDIVIKPVGDFFGGMWDNLVKGAKLAWEGIKKVFGTVAKFFGDVFSDAWTRVKNVFSIGGKIFEGIKEGIASVFSNVANQIIGGINKVVSVPFNAINTALGKIKNIDIAGAKPFENKIKLITVPQIPLINVGKYEDSGIPKSGEMFFMNENGRAEYMTKVGNKTAVVNQDHMTTALADTITRAIGSIPTGGTGDVIVYIGNDKVYQGQGEYQSRQSERYGTTYVKI